MRTRNQSSPPEASPPVNLRRRNVLLAFGVGGAGTAAVAASSLSCVAPVARAEKTGGSYRLTEHIQRYYRTAKI